MTQALVLQRVADKDTVAHESMHVAAFIYFLIKYYPELNNRKLLDEILDWTLGNVTIIETDEYYGQFCHRSWGRFTTQAKIYCEFAGMIGGYMYTNNDKYSPEHQLDALSWWIDTGHMDQKDIEFHYNVWGASKDLKNTGVTEYNERLRYIKEILSLLKGNSVFNDLFNDCMEQLENKRNLEKEDLVRLAQKYKDRILCETFTQRCVCVSITEKGPKYNYYV